MKVLELFVGTRSIGKAFERHGHEVFSVEWDKRFPDIDLYQDILEMTAEDIISKFGKPDVIWASPDCTTFSIAAISHHRKKDPVTGNLDPVSNYAKFCDKVDIIPHTFSLKIHVVECEKWSGCSRFQDILSLTVSMVILA